MIECDHLYVRVYGWSWRHPFRWTYWLRCWRCDLRIEEP